MQMAMKTIDVRALAELMKKDSGVDLIDVRMPAEYETVHAEGARLEPLDRLQPSQILATRNGKADAPVYLICKSGMRSSKACEKFIAQGFDNVVNVSGGTMAWVAAGLPVQKKGRKVLPLDRQVQTTAGFICATGVVLGTFVNPWWYLLCAMVGCGLLVAGLTGFCPMALLIQRMPWNQGSDGAGAAAACCATPATK
jgi:rhodanese-related sulfurtransferase